MFKDFGKKLRNQLHRIGDVLNPQHLFGGRNEDYDESGVAGITEIPADQMNDVTRIVRSAFRVPFYAILRDHSGRNGIPAILSLIHVLFGGT